ncbi:hypothetical protein [Bacillus sp. Marseille-P3661]|uniref:hypothetical protein n=1 Tax=Bacillus sp. Marseille-P3661 TaxID=1936234 RepID=UPI000C84EEC9|nr:hypothetical protein [Bacillus sp. Marseille-P3661]
MFTSTMEQSTKFMNIVWENWENGVQKAYDQGQEFGKLSLENLKKQQDMFAAVTVNLNKAEEEMKNSINEYVHAFNENKVLYNEDAARFFGKWNEKITEIFNKTQQLSITPSKAMLTMMEQSQHRICELAKNSFAEQSKVQAESKVFIENMMAQVKESQKKWLEMVEGQTKQTSKKAQSK